MHPRRLLAVLVPWLASLASCGLFLSDPAELAPVPSELLDRRFEPQELARELDELFAVLEEVHPDLYATLSEDEVRRRRDELVERLDRPLTRREYFPLVAELVAALGDGHTAVYFPQEEWWRDAAARSLPFDVAWIGGELRVRRVAANLAELEPGATLVSVAGRPASELFRAFLARHSSDSDASRVEAAERTFSLHLWTEGLVAPFDVEWRRADGSLARATLDGVPWDALQRGRGGAVDGGWKLARRPDGVAVLTIDTLGRPLDEFEEFLRTTFGSLHDAPALGLVIDLRQNGGGNSSLGDELLQYVATKPWRQQARKEWKMSARYRDYLKGFLAPWLRWLPVQYLHPLGRKLWGAPEGECVVLEFEHSEPRDEPLRFRGPVAFLIGPRTFSSSASLAGAVADFGLAVLVGATSGGSPNGFGEVLAFRLPRTQLRAQVSSARFVRGSGDATRRGGVEPDVAVEAPLGSTGDVVLERAVELVLGRP